MAFNLSVIIIVKNAQDTIADCLESVVWANQIIVVDSGSTDRTLEIAKNYTKEIYSKSWQGYGPQKAYALSKVTQQWVLSLDSDEVVSETLKSEIQAILMNESADMADAYEIPFQSFFLDKKIRYGDWKGESHIRLFRSQQGHFDDAQLHENLIINGTIKKLGGHIDHYSYRSIDDVLEKLRRYVIAGAKVRYAQGKKSSLLQAWLKAKWAFFRCYILKMGFLDGKAGFLLAIYIRDYTFYRYVKLIEIS